MLHNKQMQTVTNLKKELFWLVENMDETGLINFCKHNQDILHDMYFPSVFWKTLFSEEEAKKIKVYLCGVMDFNPLQHACDINWLTGAKIILNTNTKRYGGTQGSGLPVINIDKLRIYINNNCAI